MTNLTMTAADAEKTLIRLATCVERAGKLQTLKLLLQIGVSLDAGRSVQEIMGVQSKQSNRRATEEPVMQANYPDKQQVRNWMAERAQSKLPPPTPADVKRELGWAMLEAQRDTKLQQR